MSYPFLRGNVLPSLNTLNSIKYAETIHVFLGHLSVIS